MLMSVIAQRPGSTGAEPIVILAHRDAAGRDATAELSATATLIELARAFAARQTQRGIILVSTSGGAGGDAGAADFAAGSHAPYDAAIVLGDLAGGPERKPFVVPYSDGFGSAPIELQRTLTGAITQQTGLAPADPSTIGQLAHLALPFTVGEQGPLEAAGLPSVLVQVSGERGPAASAPVSRERLQSFGQAVLSAVDALDTAPNVSTRKQTGVLVQRKIFPAWALGLLIAALLLPVLVVTADGLARVRRRGEPVARWIGWTLTLALPFAACALFARGLGSLALLGTGPAAPVPPGALPFDGTAAGAVLAVGLVLVLGLLVWPAIVRRAGLAVIPDSDGAGLAMMAVLLVASVLVCVLDPYTALLLLPAAHLWLLIVSPELRPRPLRALGLVALGLLPLALLLAFYAHDLGLGPGMLAWRAVLLLAGGQIGIAGALLWSVAFGCAAAAALIALKPPAYRAPLAPRAPTKITIRGPLSYAGPGSLGGTESALRR